MFTICTGVYISIQFAATTLRDRLMDLQTDPRHVVLIQTLMDRRFSCLWTDPEFQLLRDRCTLCGGYYEPHRMLAHLLTAHAADSAGAAQMFPSESVAVPHPTQRLPMQLVHPVVQSSAYQC